MKLRGSLALKLCLCLVALAPAALPGTAPVLVANPSAVDFVYSAPAPAPQPVFVTVNASDGSSPVITVMVTSAAGTPTTLFPQPPVSGSTIQVGVDPNTLNSLVNQPPQIYSATFTVSAAGFTPIAIPVTLGVNTQLSLSASPASLTFNPPAGPTTQTIDLTGPALSFTLAASTTLGGGWLTVTSSTSFTPATLNVTVNLQNLATGTYNGSITVTPSVGLPLVLPVTLQVGANTVSASPASFVFAYTLSGTTPPPQTLTLSSTISNNTYVAQTSSSGNWLLVNGATTNVSGSLPATLNVTVNPTGLALGTYTGTITVTDAHNSTQTVTVTLVVSGIQLLANPGALTFVAQFGEATPASQTVVIPAFLNTTYTASVNQTWLSISETGGATPAQIIVKANPAGLAAGTYSGNIQIEVATRLQNIPVTFVVSADPVLITDTGEIIYNYLGGNPSSAPFTINVSVSSGASQDFSFAPGVPSWLQLTAGPATPSVLSVVLNPQGLPNGTYLADIILIPAASGGLPVTVPVLLTVVGANPVVPAPTSLTFTAPAGGSPQSQTVQITAAAATNYTAVVSTTNGIDWLTVSPTAGTANIVKTPLTVTADATTLGTGTYTGMITLTTSLGVITQIPVTFTVGTVLFTISPSTLTFTYTQGGTLPAAQTVQITGSQSFTASASTTSGTWLAVTPASGSGNATLSVSVNPTGLANGSYSGTITVTPAGSAAQTVAVTLTVATQGALTATPSPLAFAYTSGGSSPASQTLNVASTGSPLSFTATPSSSGWLSVTPTTGTTPAALTVSVNPANLGYGSYSGSIVLNAGSGTPQVTVPVALTVVTPFPVIDRVVNSASYAGGTISPGEIIVVFGSSLGPSTGVSAQIDSKGFIETSLANVQVTFNGYAAPILYASSGQINAIVPYELAGTSNVSVEVIFGSGRSNSVTMPVVASSPGIYSADESGTGPGAILDLNYHLVSASNPVSPGDIIQIFATGQGQTSPAGVDGLIEPLTPPWPALTLAPGIQIGGMPANIQYIGAAPGLVAGALQVNAYIPQGLPSGPAQVVLMIGVYGSQNGITVAIK